MRNRNKYNTDEEWEIPDWVLISAFVLVSVIAGIAILYFEANGQSETYAPTVMPVEEGQRLFDAGVAVVPLIKDGQHIGWVPAEVAHTYNVCAGGTTNLYDVETQQHVEIPLEAITFWQASSPCLFDPHVSTGGSGKVTDFGGIWFNRSYCSAVPTNDWSCTVLVSDQTARFNPLTIYVASPAVETYTVTLSLERADLTDNATIDVKKWTRPYALYLPNIQQFSNSFSSAANLTTTLVVTQ